MVHAGHDCVIGPYDDYRCDAGQPEQARTQAPCGCGSVSSMAHVCVCIQLLHKRLSSAWAVANTAPRRTLFKALCPVVEMRHAHVDP